MHVPYIIIGGGVAAASAIEGIREHDASGKILVLSRENHAPYRRALLSRDLLSHPDVVNRLSYQTDSYYTDRNVELLLRRDVVEISPESKQVWDERGNAFEFDKLLIATGVRPRMLDVPGAHHPELHYFRSLEDYLHLEHRLRQVQHALVIGEEFLALELAAAIRRLDREVTLVLAHDYPVQRVLPRDLGAAVLDSCRALGIELVSNEAIVAVEDQGGLLLARTRAGNFITTQTAIAAVGAEPNVELAEAAGLEVGNGIEVDEYTRTSARDIFAAGDVAEFPHLALGRPMRLEQWDHSVHHGRAAGANMAGAHRPYTHVPVFGGYVLDTAIEAVGDTDATFETQAVWSDPLREGVVFYLNEDRVRGILMWNLVGRADWAREIIRAGQSMTHEQREAMVMSVVAGQ